MATEEVYYFASDFHLGIPNQENSLAREKKIIRWLDLASKDATGIYLLGDIFDFWFEYKHVIPKGYTRLLGKLAELADEGIDIKVFKGNHDMWMFGYFEKELGISVISDEHEIKVNNFKLFLHHGDGLGPGDKSYKILRKVFRNSWCQKAFGFLHPFLGMGLAQYFSSKSRLAQGGIKDDFNEETESLLHYCKEKIKEQDFDFLIFGHRHLPLDIPLNSSSRYINLGEWLHYCTYARINSEGLELIKFEK